MQHCTLKFNKFLMESLRKTFFGEKGDPFDQTK